MEPTTWAKASDLHGLLVAAQCVTESSLGPEDRATGLAAILTVAERLALEVRDAAEAAERLGVVPRRGNAG